MDTVSEQRLTQIYPLLADKVRKLAELLAKENIVIRVVQGLRTIAEQDALYAQGRTKPGKKVTNCPGGKSWHNFGLALDLVPSTHGVDKPFEPDWNETHPTWKRMVEIAESLGLNCGAKWRTFKDYPHVQLTGRFPVGAPNAEVVALFKKGGLKAVWDEVTKSVKP